MRPHRSFACPNCDFKRVVRPGQTCECGWSVEWISWSEHYPYPDKGLFVLHKLENIPWLWRLLCWWFIPNEERHRAKMRRIHGR